MEESAWLWVAPSGNYVRLIRQFHPRVHLNVAEMLAHMFMNSLSVAGVCPRGLASETLALIPRRQEGCTLCARSTVWLLACYPTHVSHCQTRSLRQSKVDEQTRNLRQCKQYRWN